MFAVEKSSCGECGGGGVMRLRAKQSHISGGQSGTGHLCMALRRERQEPPAACP